MLYLIYWKLSRKINKNEMKIWIEKKKDRLKTNWSNYSNYSICGAHKRKRKN